MSRNQILEEAILNFKKRRKSLHGFGYHSEDDGADSLYYIDLAKDQLHNVYSVTKTVTAVAVGMALHENQLTVAEELRAIFQYYDLGQKKQGSITVRDLLLMTSGYVWDEKELFSSADSIVEKNQTSLLKRVLDRHLAHEPGSRYHYDSMNSHILSGVVNEVTGLHLQAYVKSRIFQPLGIESFLWDTDPEGLAFGGYGLYMRLEDMVAFGKALNDEQQMHRWVGEDFYAGMKTGIHMVPYGGYRYGYHTWTGTIGKKSYFAAFGHGGQRIVCLSSGEVLVSLGKIWPEFGPLDKFFAAWLEGSE